MPIRSLPRITRQWMLDHVSIRLRLAIWYALLLSVVLTLFSLTIFTVAQQQLEGAVDQNLRSRAASIARTLQGGLHDTGLAGPTPTASTSRLPTPTATPGPTHTAVASPAGTATIPPTPVPTPNPATQQEIQNKLMQVPDVLGQLDLGFEVMNTRGEVTYRAPNILSTGLPHDEGVISAALHEGVCGTYTQRQKGSLLRVFVEPVTLSQTAGAAQPAISHQADCQTPAPAERIVGAVVVAKTIDDVNSSLSTLSRLLVIGVFAAVVFTSLGGWLIAGNGLQPIKRMTRTARAIAINAHGAGLGRRVGYRGPRDEVGDLAATFDDMLASIERVSNAQRRFVADASHELRAPLTTIKGSLEFLRRARDLPEEERSAILDDAYTEAERMAILVNDLLLLARADAVGGNDPGTLTSRLDDQMRGRREPVELDQLALDIFRHGRAQLQARHKAQLQLKIENLEPEVVMADPGQLRQVMLILLDNAIKYTPPGGKVALAVSRKNQRAAISVSDSGIGIEPEVLPHVFERFYRGDQARARDQHGSGLGLAIAKWIVEAHNGEITVSSQPGQGTTFTVLLPALRRSGEPTSVKMPVVSRRERRLNVAGAIQPLARLAGVSRPKTTPVGPRPKNAREAKVQRDAKSGKHHVVRPAKPRPRTPTDG